MRTIILTGISRGLGKAFFDLLSTTSARIIAIGRTFPPIDKSLLASKISLIKLDLSTPFSFDITELEHLIELTTKEIIFIDNAAVIQPLDQIGELTTTEISSSISVNLCAPILLTNSLVCIAKKRQVILRILHISTGAATTPIQGWSLYCSTKAAIKMFYDCLAKEYDTISIKQIDPGVLDTKMQEIIRDWFKTKLPFKKWYKKEELSLPENVAANILRQENLV